MPKVDCENRSASPSGEVKCVKVGGSKVKVEDNRKAAASRRVVVCKDGGVAVEHNHRQKL